MSEKTDETAVSNQLNKRLKKILDVRLENDKETLEALKELSSFYKENTLQGRRNFVSQIEKQSLCINEEFLGELRKVKEALDGIHSDVASMNEMVKEMKVSLHSTKTKTHNLIEQTTRLKSENQKLGVQKEVASAFLRAYQLDAEEQAQLRGNQEGTLSKAFFPVLARVNTIHSDCRSLLQAGHQTAALDVMEQMALYQEIGLERLYRWTQANCKHVELPEVALLLSDAMLWLLERPVLFQYVLDEYATARRAVLVRGFLDALTLGGPGGTPKPIEMHAHDPQRYVGDMLAWLHQAIPLEAENLQTLLRKCDHSIIEEQIHQTMTNITEGVCPPLKVRMEQILSNDAEATVLYAITNLLRFYQKVIKEVVSGGILDNNLEELHTASFAAFVRTLDVQVKRLSDRIEPPPSELTPVSGITRIMSLLRDVLAATTVAEQRKQDISQIIACIVDPLLQVVNESAFRLPSTDMAVYMLNCIYQLQSTLSLYEYVEDRLERLQAQSEAQIDTLTSEQTSFLVANLSLSPIYTILQEPDKSHLSTTPGMDPASLKNFLSKLDSFLSMPDILLLPQIRLLQSSTFRKVVQKRSCEVIAAIYKQLYQAVHDPANLYQNPSILMPRKPEQVLELLSPP
ncbi:conserved oligomeric Golgi complex subunit 6 [Neocloeon triangulifer]|uniref:conserved oligomeric Golgi complex subunit 6 n=1 Tax=Neocloeon triangulifer TaxID=2078957 RepID=UPI00286FA9B6|nr:conserved oligomeric Golgi complex subunit 6 [Neocloeon triangulifer]